MWNGLNIYHHSPQHIDLIAFTGVLGDNHLEQKIKENESLLYLFVKNLVPHLDGFFGDDGKYPILTERIWPNDEHIQNDKVKKFENSLRTAFQSIGVNTQKISPKQWEILNLLAQGNAYKEIAKILNVSPRTVETHINHIKEKTNCFTRKALITYFNKQKHLSNC